MDATKCCPFCAEEILSAAIKCKHCGSNLTGGLPAPTAELGKKKSSAIVRYGGGFLLVCVALAIYGSFNSSPDTGTPTDTASAAMSASQPSASPQAQRSVYKTTAGQLFLDYRQNEVATDERIGNARVEISGGVESIDKDFMGHPTLKLDIGMDFNTVLLTLDKSDTAKAGRLSKGNWVTAICEKVERVISDPVGTGCVLIGR